MQEVLFSTPLVANLLKKKVKILGISIVGNPLLIKLRYFPLITPMSFHMETAVSDLIRN